MRPKHSRWSKYCLQIHPDHQEARQAMNLIRRNQSLPKPERLRGATGPIRMAEIRQMEKTSPGRKKPGPCFLKRVKKALVRLASVLFDSPDENLHRYPPTQQSKRRFNHHAWKPDRSRWIALPRLASSFMSDRPLMPTVEMMIKQAAEELSRAIEAGFNEPRRVFLSWAHYKWGKRPIPP